MRWVPVVFGSAEVEPHPLAGQGTLPGGAAVQGPYEKGRGRPTRSQSAGAGSRSVIVTAVRFRLRAAARRSMNRRIGVFR